MADHLLKPLTPLGATDARVDEFANITISENVDIALAAVAMRNGQEKPFAASAKKAFKTPLPDAGQSITEGKFTLFWSSPEQWFVEAPIDTHEDIAAILKSDFKESASITEQSGGWARFDLQGEGCVAVLERLCAVDTGNMQSNAATRTVVEHIGVFILCREARTDFSVYGPRSSADSLHHAIVTAAKSVS